MTKNFRLDSNPNSGRWRMYFLHALERAANFYDIKQLIQTDSTGSPHPVNWYALGASELIEMQRKDGSWTNIESNEVELFIH